MEFHYQIAANRITLLKGLAIVLKLLIAANLATAAESVGELRLAELQRRAAQRPADA